MTVFCQLCHHMFHSAKPDVEAQQDVLLQISQHLGGMHRAEAAGLAADIQMFGHLAATYLLMREFVTIPAAETALLESFKSNERALMEALGMIPPTPEMKKGPNGKSGPAIIA
jgi:hypothetical protein